MEPNIQKSDYTNDVFISYSRKDREFAAKLEKALKEYRPPKEMNMPQRNLVERGLRVRSKFFNFRIC
jgi:hypothetical protein